MKRRILSTITLSLVMSAALFIKSDQTASAQGQMRPVADSGIITLGRNQVLRMTVAPDFNGDGNIRVRFRQTRYEMCNASPKLCVASQTTSNPITLAPNEAASADGSPDWVVDGADYVVWRTVVLSNNRNVQVQGIVFDTATQRVVSLCCTSQTMYWP